MQGEESQNLIHQEIERTDVSEHVETFADDHLLEDGTERQSEDSEVGEKGDTAATPRANAPTVFAKVEKSLASLGFFTPSSRRIKDQKTKRIDFTRDVDGKRVGVSAEIIPSAVFGLPITADQDKWLALQRIITDQLYADSKIANPIRFKSADLLRLLNDSTKSGKNYKDVSEWLDVMSSTTIFSDGVAWAANKKRFVRDRFRVFDRAVSVGKEMDDGTVADANYVWLSTWQLENMNAKFVLPIDLETYRELKNHISKALVPHLQIWLFATHKVGHFEKRYTELCELFALQQYSAPSQIMRQLKPSLDELTHHEYLAKWRIEKTADRRAYKIIFFHGAKFHRDRRNKKGESKSKSEPIIIAESDAFEPSLPEPGKLESAVPKGPTHPNTVVSFPGQAGPEVEKLVDELACRGIMPSVATRLLDGFDASRLARVADKIEYWDSLQKTGRAGAGLLHEFIKSDIALPNGFEPRKTKEVRVALEFRRTNLTRVAEAVEHKYTEYCRQTVDRFVAKEIPVGEFERRVMERKEETAKSSGFWGVRPELAEQLARHEVRAEVTKSVPLLSLEQFRERELPKILHELGLDSAEFGQRVELSPTDQESDTPQEAPAVPLVADMPQVAGSSKEEHSSPRAA